MPALPAPSPKKLPIVAILVVPEATASVIYGLFDLFRCAGRDWGIIERGEPGESLFAPIIVARERGSLTVVNEVPVNAHYSFADCPQPDIVCAPDINVPPDAFDVAGYGPEVAWIKRCHQRGSVVSSACSGTMLLAEAGLLDGFEATTHWAYCDALSRRYNAVKVRGQCALVVSGDDQRVVMAGGGTTWLDLALYLIARTTSVEVAMQVARINLIDWHAVGQQPFARLARTRQVEDAIVGRCQEWIAQHYHEPAPVAAMVRLSGLAERSFKRRFQLSTGMSPLEYVHTLRLEEAKQMLESSDDSIESIAGAVGYEDAGFFSRLFRRNVTMSAAQYRKRFRSLRKSLTTP